MLYKLCRICSNENEWKHPTGNKSGKCFSGQNGFGMEEWINRNDWTLSGYKNIQDECCYAHITSLWTETGKYCGQDAKIFLFTYINSQALLVGYIDRARIIDEEGSLWAVQQYHRNGWLRTMRDEVKNINGNTNIFEYTSIRSQPLYYINIRFLPEDIHFLSIPQQINIHFWRYKRAYDWNNDYLPVKPLAVNQNTPLNRFSEEIRFRRAINAKEYSPRQAPIQNRLSKQLEDVYGPQGYQIYCEDNRVDISVRKNDKVSFLEIKPANTAREAIRLALGQLLEYAHYPQEDKSNRLVIVSDVPLEQKDKQYIQKLQNTYGIPLRYVYWPKGKKRIPLDKLKECIPPYA